MRTRSLSTLIVLFTLGISPAVAQASSLGPTLTDVGVARFSLLSLYLWMLILSAWGVKALWNSIASEHETLRPLGYWRALGITLLIALPLGGLFALLTEANTFTTAIALEGAIDDESPSKSLTSSEPNPSERWKARGAAFDRLRQKIWSHTVAHDGQWPTPGELDDVPTAWWIPHEHPTLRYIYREAEAELADDAIVLYEPDVYGTSVFILRRDGIADVMHPSMLAKDLQRSRSR